MKKLLLLFVATLAFASCDNDDDNLGYSFDQMATESAEIPDDMVYYSNDSDRKKYEIIINYYRPSSCYILDTPDYIESTENIVNADGESILTETRTITVINKINEEIDCIDYDNEAGQSIEKIEFTPGKAGPYLFKFWTGFDDNGENTYLEYETTVLEE